MFSLFINERIDHFKTPDHSIIDNEKSTTLHYIRFVVHVCFNLCVLIFTNIRAGKNMHQNQNS